MPNQISNWVENRLSAESTLSHFQAWINTEGGWEHYFTLLTTHALPETEIRDTENEFYVIGETRPISIVSDYIPPDETSQTDPASVTETALGGEDYQSSWHGDFRIERTFSGDPNRWGTDRAAIRGEWWIAESEAPTVQPEVREQLHNEIDEITEIDLNRYPDYRGNIVIVLEDQRIQLSIEDTARLEIDRDLLENDSSYVTAEWREYGDRIWTASADSEELRQISYDCEEPPDSSRELPLHIVTSEDDFTVDLAEFNENGLVTPGASEVRVSVIHEGVILDWVDLPLMRIITQNIQVIESESERQDETGPPGLHYDSPTDRPGISMVVGQHIWDQRRIEFGGQQTTRGWCTGADELTVAQALTSMRTDFGPVVKVVDPYLEDEQLIEFADQLSTDTELWAITTEPIETQRLTSEIATWDSADRKIGILRIVDSDGGPGGSPLHDRFILTNGDRLRGWVLGTSFDSLETNVSIISGLPNRVVNELDRTFNEWWYEPVEDRRGSDCRKTFDGTSNAGF